MEKWRDCEEYYETPSYEVEKAEFDLFLEEYETEQETEEEDVR